MPTPVKMFRENEVRITGYLGKEPFVGDAMLFFTVAVTESWKDKETNQWKEKTNWIPVSCFGPGVIESVQRQGITKGTPVRVLGKLSSYDKTDKETGQRRRVISVTAQRVWNLAVREYQPQEPGPEPARDPDHGLPEERDALDDIPV